MAIEYKKWREQQGFVDDGIKITGQFGPCQFSVSIDGQQLIALIAYVVGAVATAPSHDRR